MSSYIYFIIDYGRVVYIGQTTNLKARMDGHLNAFTFDDVRIIPCVPRLLNYYEKRWIKRFKPPCNYHFNPDKTPDPASRRLRMRGEGEKRKHLNDFPSIQQKEAA